MASPDGQGKASGGTSRFSRFGFGSQLLQKTVGLVLRPRPGKQVVCEVPVVGFFLFPSSFLEKELWVFFLW